VELARRPPIGGLLAFWGVLDNSAHGKIRWLGCQSPPCYTASGPAVLYAYQALPAPTDYPSNSAYIQCLWDSSQLTNSRTAMPGAVPFVMPTIADGCIFIAGGVPQYFGTTTCPSGTNFKCAGQLTILY
jgi:hypothetical protein